MLYIVVALVFGAFGLGGWIMYILLEKKRAEAATARLFAERDVKEFQVKLAADQGEAALMLTKTKADASFLLDQRRKLDAERAAFDSRKITALQLENENRLLKRDLLNLDVAVRKLRMDHAVQGQSQAALDERANELAERYLAEVEKWVGASINANNYAACKQRLQKAIDWCRSLGYEVSAEKEVQLLATLKTDFELAVRAAVEREEQTRIKAQIREEQAREREIQKELQALERERAAVRAALDRALADAQGTHTAEIERLTARLAEAEGKQRAVSQAQLTKAGYIYVISNLGSFGENVYKVGMTRRLEPLDRVAELGDASVPFPFDVHMMISCPDAPALENKLHREFHKERVNKVNPRKEFFRVELERIRKFVEANHGEVRFVADAEALQYHQSLTVSDEDQATIEQAFEDAERAVGVAELED